MESGTRSLLSDTRMDVPKPLFPIRLDDSATATAAATTTTTLLPDRGKSSPLTLALDATSTQLSSVTESFKTHFPHGSDGTKSLLLQGLEGTMALLAARAPEGAKGLYPLNLDGLRPFLPYGGVGGGECVKSYLQERLDKPHHKSVRDRKESKSSSSSGGGGDRTTTSSSSTSLSSSSASSGPIVIGSDLKRLHHHHHHHHHDRSREHGSSSSISKGTTSSSSISSTGINSSHSSKKVTLPKSQLSNPRHDANLTHAIRELHDEEFGLDAVLLAEGGHVGAHCAVLAAASPFLKTILLHANDHPAIISVTGTSLSTLQSLVTCLYTGNIPAGASLYHLIEAAKLLKMDELASVLQKTFFAQGGTLEMPPRSQQLLSSSQRSTTTTASTTQQGLMSTHELHPEKFGKKVRSNRLDQILYQKLNVNHLAPFDNPEPSSLVPPPSQEPARVPPLLDSPRVPVVLESPRVPPPDLHHGILGELLTKADPLRSIFSNPSIYSIPDLTFDPSRAASSLKPLNLSKSSKSETLSSSSSSTASTISSSTSTTTSIQSSTATNCSPSSSSLASSLASQTDLTLAGLTSLAPTLPGNMPGLLTPLTPSNITSMISPALVSLTTSSALASLGGQHSAITSKCKNSSSSCRSRSSKSSSGRSSSSTSSSITSRADDSSGSSSHTLPLLYTLKGGMMTPEMAKEVYEQLKVNPQLSTLAGFNSVHNLSNLSSSASLQSLASLHNLSSLQNFPTLFPFLASTTDTSQIGSVESSLTTPSGEKIIQISPTEPTSTDYNLSLNPAAVTATNLSSSVVPAEDGVLNLSSSAQTIRSESPSVTTSVAAAAAAAGASTTMAAATSASATMAAAAGASATMAAAAAAAVAAAAGTPATSGSPEESIIPSTTSECIDPSSSVNPSATEIKEESTIPTPTTVANVSTGCQTIGGPLDPADTCGTVVVASSNDINCTLSNGCSVSEEAKASLLSGQLDTSSLPLLLMTSGGTMGGMPQAGVTGSLDASQDVQSLMHKDPTLVSSEGVDTGDDTSSIEVVDEIPGISQALQSRKALFHAGPMGRKRKGCGDCEGCQVLEDCGQCRFCRDKAKFGGPNRLKQVCVYKRCVHAELEPEDSKKKRKSSGKKGRGKCGGCDGCQRTSDCSECYACLHNAAAQPPARRKVCEMRVCEQQQMEEVRATLSVAGEPSPYSTDSLMAEGINISSGASSPTPDGQPSTHNDKMKLMRKMLKKKFAQPYSRVSPSKVRTKYYCGECPGCQTTTPCGNCLYCEDMPKFGGPGRYRQKCVKQLCVYHPRLQALKLSNRSRITYDEQHIAPETLNHLGNVQGNQEEAEAEADAVVLGCEINPDIKNEEYERLHAMEHVETDLTEGEDSNAAIQVDTILEEPSVEKPEIVTDDNEKTSDNCPDTEKMSNVDISAANVDDKPAIPTPEPVLPVMVNPTDSPPEIIPTQCSLTHEPAYKSPPNITQPTVTVPPPVAEITTTVLPIPVEPDVSIVPAVDMPTPPLVRSPSPNPIEAKAPPSPVIIDADTPTPSKGVEDDDDAEEEEDGVSETSDVPSPPSTPSPPPRARGRGRNRGRGRPQMKSSTRHLGISERKENKIMRRGRRRRTTRFTLDPDDNSDFEEHLMMSELRDENSTEESIEGSKLDITQSDMGLSDATRDEGSPEPILLEPGTPNQNYSSPSFVGRSKPIDPDVFEFHDSQENVITNSHETTYSLKHNPPFVFRDEESSQGGRDVNENLGSVGETASA